VDTADLAQLTRILQLSITPVALVSGVGLLLLSMTNRLGRVIDRSRELGRAVAGAPLERSADRLGADELRILFRRARLLQVAIAGIATSVFLAALMVVTLFAMTLAGASLGWLVLGLFAVCLAALILSIACFLGDIFLSIRWLHVSLGRYVT
jgi:hypothetical protein